MNSIHARNAGYSLLELLVATVLFTIISGSVFSLLSTSQLTYQGESTIAAAFQQANVAIDQMVRDIHSAGYPPPTSFSTAVAQADPKKFALPFAWTPNYPASPCSVNSAAVGALCTIPGDNDLILEADTGAGVQWIRYSLSLADNTLKRAAVLKTTGDPVTETDGALVPYLDNVVNQAQAKQPPIFSYVLDDGAPFDLVTNIRKVNINLIVQSAQRDPKTNQFRTITVTGEAVRFNPNQ
jgi:prepilin-type N-terminal cleavage/methylation domain-containing protein